MDVEGIAYLVGAGPGDPELITLKGLHCIKKSDVIIYDWLASDELLSYARSDAELIFVGKMGTKHLLEQDRINALIVEKVKQNKIVTRLSGDPFIFGRGGEEAEALKAANLDFEIVPGVTDAVAVPAYAGIPVTHRRLASSFAVVSGREDVNKTNLSSINWKNLATAVDTLVFLMGVDNISQIAKQLIDSGRPAATPVALIRNGTSQTQETLVGTLQNISKQAQDYNFHPPAIIVVGEVVRLRDQIQWFDNRPLFGKRVLITRSRQQAGDLRKVLIQYGADVIEMPTINIEPLSDYSELDQAINDLHRYGWVVLTSVNGAQIFFERLSSQGFDSRELRGVGICAIGPATAKIVSNMGITPDFVPPKYTAVDIVAGISRYDIQGIEFLLPRAEIASQDLVDGLIRLGAKVHQISTYRTLAVGPTESRGRKTILDGGVDIITFTSSSTVKGLVSIMGDQLEAINNCTIACIGPVTADTAIGLGIRVDIVAEEHTMEGLVRAIRDTELAKISQGT
ncbi:MAG: uroporphyrinogen-III C-methyltransferase [Chloroflexota bacterium]|nr:uroporphyrinogen-III C-methyltransferase [Chloroflexota bacterium]